MYAIACEGVKEYWKSSHKGFTLTGGHLSNLAFVENNTTYELYVIVCHVPLNHIAACHPFILVNGFVTFNGHKVKLGGKVTVKICCSYSYGFILLETTGCLTYNGKHLWKHTVKNLIHVVKRLLVKIVNFCIERSTVLKVSLLNLSLNLIYLCLCFCRHSAHLCLYGCGTLTELVIAQSLHFWIYRLNLLQIRFYRLHIPIGFSAEEFS